ncbi:MAG: arabinogalactan endo-1,4-beta-galactosidase [Muribaculaceae bacterium]|nr:arabinogalactan endo-1,4-beta-galactosidase [Muribaculaceae bacterium]
MKQKIMNIMAAGAMLMACGCTEESPVTVHPEGWEPATTVIDRSKFAHGADVSWVTELEHKGYTFANEAGTEKECMELLRDDCGVNAIRLRVWVNPEQGWNDIHDVVVKARRANNLGLRVMIDFHFSDTWADPGAQITPAAWADMELPQLKEAMAAHVTETLNALKNVGVEPEWVQIGNETRGGMMLPLGGLDAHFAELVDNGYEAVKAVLPEAKVVVHIDCGDQLWLYTRVFDKLKTAGTRYDVIGMSLYPDPSNWSKTVDDCLKNISTLATTYGKRLVIAEVGMDYREADAADAMMRSLYAGCTASGVVDGIFWWEPEAPAEEGYTKGCFDNGRPTKALDVFKENI